MKNLQTYEEFLNESTATQKLEMSTNEIVTSINEAKTVITPDQAKEIKDGVQKAIEGINETPGIDDKTKTMLVKTGIGLAVLKALADKFENREATPEAKAKMKDFMSKVNSAKGLDEVQKVIFNVVDYALEIAQNTK